MPDGAVLAAKIELLVLDVDGVLTDGGLYYDPEGNVTKRFDVQDGLGIKIGQSAGLKFAVITGLNHGSVESRVKELGIEEYHAGHLRKVPLLQGIAKRLKLEMDQIAYIGDDWVDAAPMGLVGLPIAVPNAQPEILEIAEWVTHAQGGHGAVREAIHFILKARGLNDEMWRRWAG